jgi:L-threonylcarbamoyladenylate synthase
MTGTIGLVDLKSKTERLDARRPEDIFRAAELLRTGHTVAFPTETVYGLGANALSVQAVARIYEAKKRPDWDPLIVHVCDRAMVASICAPPLSSFRSAAEESAFPGGSTAETLMQKFWPGPLTLLLPRSQAVPNAVTAGRPFVGVRMPNHAIALELIRLAGVPIAAPSANLFGHTSPTTAEHVLADLDGRIDAVLDGGPTGVGVESTVVGLPPDGGVMIYRPGAITEEMLANAIPGGLVQRYVAPSQPQSPQSQPSPGVSLRHYAPRARLLLVEIPFRFTVPQDELIEAVGEALAQESAVGVMLPEDWTCSDVPFVYPWGPWSRHDILAQRLFSGLRALDDAGASIIICPIPLGEGLATAIRDRLQKAATPH